MAKLSSLSSQSPIVHPKKESINNKNTFFKRGVWRTTWTSWSNKGTKVSQKLTDWHLKGGRGRGGSYFQRSSKSWFIRQCKKQHLSLSFSPSLLLRTADCSLRLPVGYLNWLLFFFFLKALALSLSNSLPSDPLSVSCVNVHRPAEAHCASVRRAHLLTWLPEIDDTARKGVGRDETKHIYINTKKKKRKEESCMSSAAHIAVMFTGAEIQIEIERGDTRCASLLLLLLVLQSRSFSTPFWTLAIKCQGMKHLQKEEEEKRRWNDDLTPLAIFDHWSIVHTYLMAPTACTPPLSRQGSD